MCIAMELAAAAEGNKLKSEGEKVSDPELNNL